MNSLSETNKMVLLLLVICVIVFIITFHYSTTLPQYYIKQKVETVAYQHKAIQKNILTTQIFKDGVEMYCSSTTILHSDSTTLNVFMDEEFWEAWIIKERIQNEDNK